MTIQVFPTLGYDLRYVQRNHGFPPIVRENTTATGICLMSVHWQAQIVSSVSDNIMEMTPTGTLSSMDPFLDVPLPPCLLCLFH